VLPRIASTQMSARITAPIKERKIGTSLTMYSGEMVKCSICPAIQAPSIPRITAPHKPQRRTHAEDDFRSQANNEPDHQEDEELIPWRQREGDRRIRDAYHGCYFSRRAHRVMVAQTGRYTVSARRIPT